MATDTPDQNLSQYFSISNDFIHAARIRNGNVLIHCLAGMSRSVTIVVAYVMTISNLSWEDALKVVKSGRRIANPNAGFQNQLTDFQSNKLREVCFREFQILYNNFKFQEKRRFRQRFPQSKLDALDKDLCVGALTTYDDLLKNKSICEGNCKLADTCPTGSCHNASQKKIFKPRKKLLSKTMSIKETAKSCPSSPSHPKIGKKQQSDEFESTLKPTMSSQSLRYRSSPAGLSSYTGSFFFNFEFYFSRTYFLQVFPNLE